MAHTDLYIVDNSSTELSVKKYLNEWCGISRQMDIATGYFEIDGLLELEGNWQKLEKIRIILGSEITKRTNDIFVDIKNYFLNGLNKSIENEKEKTNSFPVFPPCLMP
ncbi:MAG: hypothetical protein LBC76_11175 [Treponema sp.]|nr:hypothetical protein [Treponema sp.]